MDFSIMYQTWLKLMTQLNEAVYTEEAEKPYANLSTALIWIVIASVIAGVLGAVAALVNGLLVNIPMMGSMFGRPDIPVDVPQQFAQFQMAGVGMSSLGSLILTPIIIPIVFLVISTIYFLFAKLLGGNGDFEKHTYMLAATFSPVLIINGVISIIPVVGGCLGLVIYIYQMVLSYFAVKTVHQLGSGKAVLVAATPIFIFLGCLILWAIAFVSMMSLVSSGVR